MRDSQWTNAAQKEKNNCGVNDGARDKNKKIRDLQPSTSNHTNI